MTVTGDISVPDGQCEPKATYLPSLMQMITDVQHVLRRAIPTPSTLLNHDACGTMVRCRMSHSHPSQPKSRTLRNTTLREDHADDAMGLPLTCSTS